MADMHDVDLAGDSQKTAQVGAQPSSRQKSYVDPFRPTRTEVLREVARRNGEGIAARFSLGEIIREAEAAVADGDLVWETRGGWTGRWMTPQGAAKLQ